jgi:hypothetical protein
MKIFKYLAATAVTVLMISAMACNPSQEEPAVESDQLETTTSTTTTVTDDTGSTAEPAKN